MLDGTVHEGHRLAKLVLEHIVLGLEVKQPERDSWVLFIVVAGAQSSLLLHRAQAGVQEVSYQFDLFRNVIELSHVHHDGRHALDDQRSHVLL